MNLRSKTVIFFVVFFAICGYFTMVLSRSVLETYKELEQVEFQIKLKQTQEGFEEILNQHEAILKDWSKWDDAYEFVIQPNDNFINQNFIESLFIDQKINYGFLFDSKKKIIKAMGYDYENKIEKAVPSGVENIILNSKNKNGIINSDGKLIVYTRTQVYNSKGDSEPLGVFAFAFDFTDKYIDHLSSIVNNEIKLELMSEEKLLENDRIGYLSYNLTNDDTKLVLKQFIPEDISSLGHKSLLKYLTFFAGAIFVIALVIYFGVQNTVFRIIKLNEDVKKIQASSNINLRLDIKGKDELGVLRDNINDMLYQIESMHFQLTNYATYDNLTGVMNRRAGFEKLDLLMSISSDFQTKLSIAFIDVNGLKYVNDTFGHNIGDQYLKKISEVVGKNISDADIFCRAGGDEFLVVFNDCNEAEARRHMALINQCLKAINESEVYDYPMSIAKGIVEYDGQMDIVRYVELADERMYEDKKFMRMNKKYKIRK